MLTEDCQTDFDFVPKTDFDSALSDLSKAREENELMQKKLEEAETKARDIQEEFDNQNEELTTTNEENDRLVDMVAELWVKAESAEEKAKSFLRKIQEY